MTRARKPDPFFGLIRWPRAGPTEFSRPQDFRRKKKKEKQISQTLCGKSKAETGEETTVMASLCHSHVLQTSLIPSSSTSLTNAYHVRGRNFRGNTPWRTIQLVKKSRRVSFALTESDSQNKSLEPSPQIQILLQELAGSFDLPPDYFAKLPNDLRLDLNDAAFDLSNGPVLDQCGQNLGETLLNLSRAWEIADAPSSCTLVKKLPSLENSLTDNQKSALGRRLVSAGRRFQAMGQYGQGELQKIAKSMITAGKLLSSITESTTSSDEQPKSETRMFKFGELQIQVTPENAYIGAAISFVFGILSWQISQGIQSVPESSMEYANDNALLLAKSLRGTLLIMFYGSTVLSAFASLGLLLLGRELSSNSEKEK